MFEVVLLRYPAEAERRRRFLADGIPRLLLVDGDHAPPVPEDCLEDWIRVPADDRDVRLRIEGIGHRLGRHGSEVPQLDPHGVLRFAATWVSLPPVEARLTAAFVERFGLVVSREALTRAGWPDGAPGRNVLDVHMLRLRRRLTAVGLSIKTVRSRGYLMEASEARQPHAREA